MSNIKSTICTQRKIEEMQESYGNQFWVSDLMCSICIWVLTLFTGLKLLEIKDILPELRHTLWNIGVEHKSCILFNDGKNKELYYLWPGNNHLGKSLLDNLTLYCQVSWISDISKNVNQASHETCAAFKAGCHIFARTTPFRQGI